MNAVTTIYLNTKEAARLLGVSPTTFEKGRCGKSKINPPHIKVGRMVRYDKSVLIAWMEERRIRNGR